MKCDQCGAKVKELYPLNGKDYCGPCVPKEYRKLYPNWGKVEKKRNEASA